MTPGPGALLLLIVTLTLDRKIARDEDEQPAAEHVEACGLLEDATTLHLGWTDTPGHLLKATELTKRATTFLKRRVEGEARITWHEADGARTVGT